MEKLIGAEWVRLLQDEWDRRKAKTVCTAPTSKREMG
ncbi:hypothetical protein J2X07_001071 [Fictibacillus barbaricus]|uniref:Uncharacterized protein n=1 Tax=Fictibacillus barbaricus TaxID=182136 RepID=A0ABU1TY21_9BACL|nr:hypothetical protein [Fictibacillus barbaricus]